MHDILCHRDRTRGRAGSNVDAVHPSIARQQPGRWVVNNVKTVGRTPYRIPAGKYDDDATQQLDRTGRVLVFN